MKVLCYSVLLLWCLVSSVYASDEEDFRQQLKQNIGNYIEECGYEDDGFVNAVVDIAYGEFGHDPWVYTMVAFYESRWDSTTVGAAGERGWIQIHPCHKRKRFKDKGRDWDTASPEVFLRVGCEMVQESLDAGRTMYSAFSPWTTRKRAWKRYASYTGNSPRKDGKHPDSP